MAQSKLPAGLCHADLKEAVTEAVYTTEEQTALRLYNRDQEGEDYIGKLIIRRL